MYLLCHQAGCPVYVIRDMKDNCGVAWHPCTDETRNVIHIVTNNNVLELKYEDKIDEFVSLEELKRDRVLEHMLGDNPFDSDYCIWKREVA